MTTSLCDRKDADKTKLYLLNLRKINPLPGFYLNVVKQFTESMYKTTILLSLGGVYHFRL